MAQHLAEQEFAGDALQPPLVPRSGFQARLKPGVGLTIDIGVTSPLEDWPHVSATRLRGRVDESNGVVCVSCDAVRRICHYWVRRWLFLKKCHIGHVRHRPESS